MKKIIIIGMLACILFLLCSCSTTTYIEDFDGTKHEVLWDKFIQLEHNDNWDLFYDKDTKIIYINLTYSKYRSGLSPYYIVKDGEAVIAIYGKNYK